jgi:hypothetical protein
MTSSKATSAVWGSGLSACPCCGLSGLGFFAGTAPFLSALLGSVAGAEPSEATSATRYQQPEWIGLALGVVAELEFIDVERHVGFGHLVESADDAALEQRPEAFDRVRVDCADDILLVRVPDNLVGVFPVQPAIADPFIGDEQRHLVGNDFAHKPFQRRCVNTLDDTGNDLSLAAIAPTTGFLPDPKPPRPGPPRSPTWRFLALPPTKVSSTSTSPNN